MKITKKDYIVLYVISSVFVIPLVISAIYFTDWEVSIKLMACAGFVGTYGMATYGYMCELEKRD